MLCASNSNMTRSLISVSLGIHPLEQPEQLVRLLGLEHARRELGGFLQVGPEHLLLDLQQLRRVHRELPQAEAEKRRAMAVAHEQEMVAKQAENRALVVLAEADVPKAMADAFRNGHLGVMDYYRMRNVQADTAMREAVARPGDGMKS